MANTNLWETYYYVHWLKLPTEPLINLMNSDFKIAETNTKLDEIAFIQTICINYCPGL